MNYFIIQDKLTAEYVCDVDEQVGVCWSKDKGERVVFVNDHKTSQWLATASRFLTDRTDCIEHIEVDEDGYEIK